MKGRSRQPRVTASPSPEALAKERTAVRNGKADSLSAYVADSLQERIERGALRALLDEMDRKVGKPSPTDQAWARRVLGI
jgi:hypothetical protein